MLDGEDEWRNLVNDTDPRHRGSLVRMNIAIPEETVALDDCDGMESLSQEVLLQYQTRGDDLFISTSLLISRLFFVLDAVPEFTAQGLYHCRGMIRCRLPGSILTQVTRKLDIGPCAFVIGDEVLGTTEWEYDVCRSCRRYTKRVEFFVRDPEEQISISVHNEFIHRDLGAFPQCITWFVQQQGLDALFGSKGQVSSRFVCPTCTLLKESARKRRGSVTARSEIKRRRK